jgi:aromatic ring hydroxylase
MPARTGEQFLNGLRGPREVWVDGERTSDVVDHPKLRGAADTLAEGASESEHFGSRVLRVPLDGSSDG